MNCIFKPHFGESYWVRFGMEVEVEVELGYWGCSLDEKERFQGNTLKAEIESKKRISLHSFSENSQTPSP